MPASPGHRFAVVTALLAALLCVGCGKDDVTQPPATDDTSLSEADSLLGIALLAQLNSDPQRPSDIDFSEAYTAYSEALNDPNLSGPARQRARFGVSVLALMTLAVDSEVNAAFDEWSNYLESHVPFEVVPGPNKMLGIPVGLTGGGSAIRLPFDVVPLSIVAQSRSALGGTIDPQIARIQAILRDRVLPRLSLAINHLGTVGADPSFQFIVTPQMQGDDEAEPVEIDRTDALALRAACRLLASACHVAVAYRLNFPAYDGESLLDAIQQDGDWLGLLPDGGTHMSAARMEILGSLTDVESTINSLESESDDQDNDVIRIGPDGVEQAGLDSVMSRIGQVRQAFEGGYTLLANWDGNYGTPMVPLTIRLRPMFETPVQNWKALLPPYTGTVREVPFHENWNYDYGTYPATFTIPTARYYYAYFNLNVEPGQRWESFSGDSEIVNGLRALAETRLDSVSALPDWGGKYSFSSSHGGDLAVGTQVATVQVYISYSITTNSVSIPVITWEATQFSEWIWPDPTMNGLFPDLTTTQEFFDTFGIDAHQWTRENVLDWTRIGNAPNARSGPARLGQAPAGGSMRRGPAPTRVSTGKQSASARYGRPLR